MPIWNETKDSLLGLECKGTPYCPFCDIFMRGKEAVPHTFLLDENKPEERSYAIDVTMICPECGYVETFGVAITKEHFFNILNHVDSQNKGTW